MRSHPIAGTERAAHGWRGAGLGPCPRWNITAFNPNNGAVNDLGGGLGFGSVIAIGVEGTGSYGAELARILAKEAFQVVEVNRPNRQARRLRGKSDPLDAYQAAQSVLADHGTSIPKSRDGN